MSIFDTSQITLSLQRQYSKLLSKSDRLRIENGGTKIDPPLNLKSVMHTKPMSKYNETRHWGSWKLVYWAHRPFHIKTFLGKKSYEVQSYNDPTYGICKYIGSELYLLPPVIYLMNPFKLWTPSSSTIQTPLLHPHFRNFYPFNYITTTLSRYHPSNPTDEEVFKSHTPLAKLFPTIK